MINPLVATIYSDQKTKRLNMLHAWWPGGQVIGGLLAVAMSAFGASWQLKLVTILIPAAVYLFMAFALEYPQTERVAVEHLDRRHVARGGEAAVPAAVRLHVDDGGRGARARPVVPEGDGRRSCRSCRACCSSSTPRA